MPRQKKNNPELYQRIGDTLLQCLTCKRIIRGTDSNMKRHQKTHESAKTKLECPVCKKLYSQKSYVKKHCFSKHNLQTNAFKEILLVEPPIERIQPWNPPFEAKPRCILTAAEKPGMKNWDPQITKMLNEMIRIPTLISPLPSDSEDNCADSAIFPPITEDVTSRDPTPASSNDTICMDERQCNYDTEVFIYSVYGIFS